MQLLTLVLRAFYQTIVTHDCVVVHVLQLLSGRTTTWYHVHWTYRVGRIHMELVMHLYWGLSSLLLLAV
jgi:hypothetical protein